MLELQRRDQAPQALQDFLTEHPDAGVELFDGHAFRHCKKVLRQALNEDQGGLCVYCERQLAPDQGQLEHIKPKGVAAYAGLCFVYQNLAHSCINPLCCGQKKKDGILPTEPGPGCNADFCLQTDGYIMPSTQLSRQRRHQAEKTRDMLGLNKDSALVADRKKACDTLLELAQAGFNTAELQEFMAKQAFRDILRTLALL